MHNCAGITRFVPCADESHSAVESCGDVASRNHGSALGRLAKGEFAAACGFARGLVFQEPSPEDFGSIIGTDDTICIFAWSRSPRT